MLIYRGTNRACMRHGGQNYAIPRLANVRKCCGLTQLVFAFQRTLRVPAVRRSDFQPVAEAPGAGSCWVLMFARPRFKTADMMEQPKLLNQVSGGWTTASCAARSRRLAPPALIPADALQRVAHKQGRSDRERHRDAVVVIVTERSRAPETPDRRWTGPRARQGRSSGARQARAPARHERHFNRARLWSGRDCHRLRAGLLGSMVSGARLARVRGCMHSHRSPRRNRRCRRRGRSQSTRRAC